MPIGSITNEPQFYQAGEVIGDVIESNGHHMLHIELYRIHEGVEYVQDPSQFIPLVQNPSVTTDFSCNEVVAMVNGVVVDMSPAVSGDMVRQYIGDPLVDIMVPGHEFPHPYDLVISNDLTLSSPATVQFFQETTSLMVGVIPVIFCK